MTAARYAVSPRTAERPMAFTPWEFVRGSLIAWAVFNALTPVAFVLAGVVTSGIDLAVLGSLPIVLIYAPILTLPWSLGALVLVGELLALLLGLALRRVAAVRVHIAAFAMLGAVVGAGTTIVYSLTIPSPSIDPGFTLLLTAITAGSVAVGWWHTARWALRDDADGEGDPLVPAATEPPAEEG